MADFFYSQSAAQLQSNMDKVSATTGDLIDTNNLDSNVSSLGYIKSLGTDNYAHFKDERAAGTNGGTSPLSTTVVRKLNTTEINNITGCSLSLDQVTLDVGVYLIHARAPAFAANNHRITLYNATDAVNELVGTTVYTANANGVMSDGLLCGILTVSGSPKNFELRHYTAASVVNTGFGVAGSDGNVETYSELFIRSVV